MLYVMRHGKTDWNAQYKVQGRTDIPLNEEGRQMAEDAAKEYAGVSFDICYCSPLSRAKETAEIVLRGRDVPIYYDDRLVEMSFGIYEGTEKCYTIPDCPLNTLFQHPEEYKTVPEGAESLEELYARTGEFLQEVIYPQMQQGKDILIVGHGVMNSAIICQAQNIPLSELWKSGIENCKLMKVL